MRLGIDLIAADGLDRLLGRRWFDGYAFAAAELAEAGRLSASRRREFLAGRFAAKEAVLKVLGTGLFEGVPPRHITIGRRPGGAPGVTLSGAALRAAEAAGVTAIAVSITHTSELIAAAAVGWSEPAS
jgi:holo-[acyl-carrier protein] synthase